MTNTGKVLKVNDNSVTVLIIRKGSCGENCVACKACANGNVHVEAYTEIQVKQGDLVEIESNSAYVYLGLLMLFIAPITFPLVTYFLFIKAGLLISISAAIFALILTLLSVFYISRCKMYLNKVRPRIIKVMLN